MRHRFMSLDDHKDYEPMYFSYWNCSPLISIHVPTYKKKYLNIGYKFTINTVVLAYLQTFKNWELRLIDNHDGDLDLHYLFDEVEKILGKSVDRTKIIYHKSIDDTIGGKRNELIQQTIAPIICNWDDDDLYLSKYLFIIQKFYKDNPYRFGIIAGKRWQYNLMERERLIWSNTTCDGAGYYVLRTDILKYYTNIRYATRNQSEETIFLRELNKVIGDIDLDELSQSHIPIDKQYVRVRFGGNMTDKEGWENDIRIKNKNGGYLIKDEDFEWLFSKIPVELHERYRKLIN